MKDVRLRMMSPSSSKQVKTSISITKLTSTIAKVPRNSRENVLVEDEREASAGVARFGGAVDALSFRCFVCVGFRCGFEPAAYGCDRGEGGASGGHLAQEKHAASSEEHVGQPDADSHGQLVLAGQSGAGRRQEVVDEDQGDGEDESRALAAALGGDVRGGRRRASGRGRQRDRRSAYAAR